MYGCQCPRRLWLHKYRPDLRDEMTEEQAAIFQTGTDVGLLAQGLFPGGVNAEPPTPFEYQKSVAATSKYIQDGATVIYEAAFQVDGVLAAIDILVKKNGYWYAYEVKSTASAKDTHIQDAALQYWVITRSGIPLRDIFILHMDTTYIRRGQLDPKKLFKASSVKEAALDLQDTITRQVVELKKVLRLEEAPDIQPGAHCNKPYACDFQGFCGPEEEDPTPGKDFIDTEAIREFISGLKYPLHFMDFETWSAVVPEQDGHWPFRRVPFQYSVHIQAKPGGEHEHRHYLADGPDTPHRAFAENLLGAIEKKGTVLVYNQTFENGILNELKAEFPDLAPRISQIQDRIIDLMVPFRRHYRVPAMGTRWSIKVVLPALVPELGYDQLTIGDGGEASRTFYNLRAVENPVERETVREALLEYCGMDTWAMVKLLEKLKGIM